MPVGLFANRAVTTVTAGGTTAPAQGTQETWTVASSASFPAASPPAQFHVSDSSEPQEIIAVTNVSGTTWTVTRGAESTTPVAHTAGFVIYQVTTAGDLGAFRQDYNVRSPLYGATGNGTANDAPAIQSAITACQNAGGGTVYIPEGTYLLGAPLTMTAPVTVQGAGRDTTILRLANGVNDYAVKFTQPSGAITAAHFADFQINGNASNQTAGGGISAAGAVQCVFERLHFSACYNWGLALQGQPGGAFGHHNRVINCLFDGAAAAGIGGGIWATSSDENFFYGCDLEYLGGTTAPAGAGSYPVMFLDQAGLQQVTSCCFVGSRGGVTHVTALRVQSASNTRITGCTFDGCGGDGVFVTGSGCVINDNTFVSVGDQCPDNGQAAGIHLEFAATLNTVTGNTLSSSATSGKTGWLIYEQQLGSSGSNVISANTFKVNGSLAHSVLETDGIASVVRSNIGYNPVGALASPAIPASGTPYANPYNVDAALFITGGTVTAIAVSGVTTGLTSGQFFLPAAGTVTLTYSVAPSWTWIGN